MIRSWLLTITSVLGLLPRIAAGQLASEEMSQARSVISSRIEALTILGGDFGLRAVASASPVSVRFSVAPAGTRHSTWLVRR
jgi:hypothetical protein